MLSFEYRSESTVELLAENAAWRFSQQPVSRKQVFNHLKEILLQDEWDRKLMDRVYAKYLEKISNTARQMIANGARRCPAH